ncbi:MAG: hypothetical protein R6U43_11795 [Candidatus Krumholzibacteriales bacterium]
MKKLITASFIFLFCISFYSYSLQACGNCSLPLCNGGFEEDNTYNGWPSQTCIWSYDDTEVVAAENGITPFEGNKMVRFISTLQSGGGADYSSLFQVLEVTGSEFEDDIASGTFFFSVEYSCNRVAGDTDTDREFILEVFGYDTSTFPQDWHSNYVFRESTSIITDGNPETWETINLTTSNLPESTTYISIHIAAHEDVNNGDSPEFDGHYADNVKAFFGSVDTEDSSWGAVKSIYRN